MLGSRLVAHLVVLCPRPCPQLAPQSPCLWARGSCYRVLPLRQGLHPRLRSHLISPVLQMRRLRPAWSHSAGKRQSKKSNLPLWDLGFKRDAIRFAFSEALSASRPGGERHSGWGRPTGRLGSRSPPPYIGKPRSPEKVPRSNFHRCKRRAAHFHKVGKRLHKFINDGFLLNY